MNTWTETEDKESGQGCCCVGWRSCHTGRPGSWPSGPLPLWPAYPPNGGWSSVSCNPKGFLQKMASMEKSACIVFVFDTCLYKDLGNTLWISCINTLWLEDVNDFEHRKFTFHDMLCDSVIHWEKLQFTMVYVSLDFNENLYKSVPSSHSNVEWTIFTVLLCTFITKEKPVGFILYHNPDLASS